MGLAEVWWTCRLTEMFCPDSSQAAAHSMPSCVFLDARFSSLPICFVRLLIIVCACIYLCRDCVHAGLDDGKPAAAGWW